MKRGILAEFLGPLFAVAAVTVALGATGADLAIEALFYSPGAGWLYGDGEPWTFLYHYGNIPAFVIGGVGVLACVMSFISPRHRPDRVASLFIVVFLALGPGLIVNTLFKDNWGRPRPADVVQFGGTDTYRPFWDPGGKGRSFPSGHAAIGFFVMAPFFVLRHKSPAWARRVLVTGLFYGLLMGLTRMIQGGHFLTDVIWSGCLVYLTGLFLYYLFRLNQEKQPLL